MHLIDKSKGSIYFSHMSETDVSILMTSSLCTFITHQFLGPHPCGQDYLMQNVIILLLYPSTDIQSPLEKQQHWLQRLLSKPLCSFTGFTPSTKIARVHFELDPQRYSKTSRSSWPEQRREGLRISICPTKCTPTLDQYWLFFTLATWIPF